jgi:hypothetical protein
LIKGDLNNVNNRSALHDAKAGIPVSGSYLGVGTTSKPRAHVNDRANCDSIEYFGKANIGIVVFALEIPAD